MRVVATAIQPFASYIVHARAVHSRTNLLQATDTGHGVLVVRVQRGAEPL